MGVYVCAVWCVHRHGTSCFKSHPRRLPRAYVSVLPNFIFIKISLRDLRSPVVKLIENYEEKIWFCVTVTLTLNQRSPISIGSEPVQSATIYRKPRPFGWNFVNKEYSQPDRQTDKQTHTQVNCCKNITLPQFRGGVKKNHIPISTIAGLCNFLFKL